MKNLVFLVDKVCGDHSADNKLLDVLAELFKGNICGML